MRSDINRSIALRQPQAVLPSAEQLATMRELAKTFVESGLLPSSVKTWQAALLIIQKGQELRVPPTYALSNIVVIQGKPTAGAELMAALIYRDQGDDALIVRESTKERCTVAYKRRSWPSHQTYTFDLDDAKLAGLLGKENWQKYPGAMLRARAISAVAKMAFQDSIGGLYHPDELGAEIEMDADGNIISIREAEPVQRPTPPEPEPEPLDAEFSEPEPEPTPRAPRRSILPHDLITDIREKQVKQLIKQAGWSNDQVFDWLGSTGVEKVRELTNDQADALCRELQRDIVALEPQS